MTPAARPLDLATFPLRGRQLIEASAGTGKTYTLAALYVRLVLGHGDAQSGFGRPLMPPEIVVMTFTNAAKGEIAVNMHQVFEDKQARIPVSKTIRNDLHSVKKIVTASNNIRYDADRNENGHADRFWAAGLGLHAGQMAFSGPAEYQSAKHRRLRQKGAY